MNTFVILALISYLYTLFNSALMMISTDSVYREYYNDVIRRYSQYIYDVVACENNILHKIILALSVIPMILFGPFVAVLHYCICYWINVIIPTIKHYLLMPFNTPTAIDEPMMGNENIV